MFAARAAATLRVCTGIARLKLPELGEMLQQDARTYPFIAAAGQNQQVLTWQEASGDF